ncbi:hypothetical protein [Homoserinibacter sp. YIM 151385]|uniref:hypothetical protein n=1 Tax=Homoserinibacter sp. YIM 151385 TaxID=2985506 RepID=UPI0022EFDDF4|nr:hypothetical protein [Homoserinibacter sp. YIM 151385]WBU37107.1 hypothetical protein OF852_09235 [Homoserinibacter sp. YIM 151385]
MVRAELLKLSTLPAPRIAIAIGAAGLALTQLLFVTLIPALASGAIGPGVEELGEDLPVVDLASRAAQLGALDPLGGSSGAGSIGVAVIAIALLGVLAGTSDLRSGGIASALIAQPRRGRLLASKAAAVAVAGAVAGLVYALVSGLALAGSLAILRTPLVLGPLDVIATLGRGIGAIACLAVIGLAVGLIARRGVAGVLAMLGILFLEPIIQSAAQLIVGELPAWAQVLPLALARATIGAAPGLLPPAVAGAALLALTALALGIATAVLRRRDV